MAAKRGGEAERRWRTLIGQQERSGLAVGEFARRRGVSPATLYWWRSHLARQVRRQSPRLVPVEVVGTEHAVSKEDGGFELELAGGRRLRVPARFDAGALSRLIVVVERAC